MVIGEPLSSRERMVDSEDPAWKRRAKALRDWLAPEPSRKPILRFIPIPQKWVAFQSRGVREYLTKYRRKHSEDRASTPDAATHNRSSGGCGPSHGVRTYLSQQETKAIVTQRDLSSYSTTPNGKGSSGHKGGGHRDG